MTRLLSYDEFRISQLLIEKGLSSGDYSASNIVIKLRLIELPTTEARLARAALYRDFKNAGEKSSVAFAKALAGEPAPAPLLKEAVHTKEETA